MVVLDATIVNVALPSIQRGLRFSPSSLQWVINMYTLIFGGFMLLGGRAGDLIGRKRVFGAGIVLFSGASLLDGDRPERSGCWPRASCCLPDSSSLSAAAAHR
jgi:MFS family permease